MFNLYWTGGRFRFIMKLQKEIKGKKKKNVNYGIWYTNNCKINAKCFSFLCSFVPRKYIEININAD